MLNALFGLVNQGIITQFLGFNKTKKGEINKWQEYMILKDKILPQKRTKVIYLN